MAVTLGAWLAGVAALPIAVQSLAVRMVAAGAAFELYLWWRRRTAAAAPIRLTR